MNLIELKIHKFLKDIASKPYTIPQELLEKFGKETQHALKRQFEREPREFNLYMSNIGRPLCQLQMEKLGYKGHSEDILVRNLYGDLVEDIVLFLLHASGIKVLSELQRVSLDIGGITLNGECDVILDLGDGPSVWDIKSASDWAFRNKYNNFNDFWKEDTFGYVTQLCLYATGLQVKAGGWIIADKSSGALRTMACPEQQGEIIGRVLRDVSERISIFSTSHILQFEDVSRPIPTRETFKGKPTGKYVLPTVCELCKHKLECWPNLAMGPRTNSKAREPVLVYYVDENKEC